MRRMAVEIISWSISTKVIGTRQGSNSRSLDLQSDWYLQSGMLQIALHGPVLKLMKYPWTIKGLFLNSVPLWCSWTVLKFVYEYVIVSLTKKMHKDTDPYSSINHYFHRWIASCFIWKILASEKYYFYLGYGNKGIIMIRPRTLWSRYSLIRAFSDV